jgi:hypothetical protein
MTHNEMVDIVYDNIKKRNEVYEKIKTELDKLSILKIPIPDKYYQAVLNYAKKINKPNFARLLDKNSPSHGIKHTRNGIIYKHHTYGPSLDRYNITYDSNYILFTNNKQSNNGYRYGAYDFAFDLKDYDVEKVKTGMELVNIYRNLFVEYDKSAYNLTTVIRDNIKYQLVTGYDTTGLTKYIALLADNMVKNKISQKTLILHAPFTAKIDFEKDIENENEILKFLPLIQQENEKKLEKLKQQEEKINTFLAPYLVMRALKNK